MRSFIALLPSATTRVSTWAACCFLISTALAHSGTTRANDRLPSSAGRAPIFCSVSSLQKLIATDVQAFEIHKESITGHSSEGGTLAIYSRGGVPQRARVDLFGETGKVHIEVAHLGGEAIVIVRWTEYQDQLPKLPVRIRKIETLRGYICSDILIMDREESKERGNHKIEEFQNLVSWLLSELKTRNVFWNLRLPEVTADPKSIRH